jgi:hypothetical protein
MGAFQLFGALMVAHVVCDYPLQGDFLAKAKNRAVPIPGFPWWQGLGAHALMHAGAVAWLTGVWWLGAAEFVAHAVTDDAKCMGRLSLNQDQLIHAICKGAWVLIVVLLLNGPRP